MNWSTLKMIPFISGQRYITSGILCSTLIGPDSGKMEAADFKLAAH